MAPGIRCPIQGQQSGTERRCADRFKRSWRPRLEELYARERTARTPPLMMLPEPYSAPSSPVHEAVPGPSRRHEQAATETTPLLGGRLATPSNRWVVRSYSARQSRDLLYTAGRLEALTPPPSPNAESPGSLRPKPMSRRVSDVERLAEDYIDLEAGRPRQDDEKSQEVDVEASGEDDVEAINKVASRRSRTWEVCQRVLFVLLTTFYIYMIVMALRERYSFV